MTKYSKEILVEFEDIDMAGVLNSSKYFNYLERSRIGFLKYIDFPLEKMISENMFALVQRYEIDYIKPIHFGQKIKINVIVEDFSVRKCISQYTICSLDDFTVYAKAKSIMVFVDSKGKPADVSQDFSDKMNNYII